MAEALAASCPSYLGKPTMPPISWAQNGEIVTVILADGRKVSASVLVINQIMFDQGLNELPEKFANVEIPPLASAQPASKPTAKPQKPQKSHKPQKRI